LDALITSGVGIVGTLAGIIVGAVLAYYFTFLRDLKVAKGVFHAAFADLLTPIHDGIADSTLVKNTSVGHEKAISIFQVYLWGKNRDSFKTDRDHYRECRKNAQANETLLDKKPQERDALVKAIRKLLSYAENERKPCVK